MSRILALAILLLVICTNYPTNGIVPSILECPKLIPQKSFNLTRYMGNWYEYEKFWYFPEEVDLSSCLSLKYFPTNETKENQQQFGVELEQKLTGQPIQNSGISILNSTDGSARLILDLLITQSPVPFRFRVPYIVIHTDYDNYVIKWACVGLRPAGEFHIQYLSILSRKRGILPPRKRKEAYKIIKKAGLSTEPLKKSAQSDCN